MKKFLVFILTSVVIFLFILLQDNLINVIPLFGIKGNLGILLVSGIGYTSGGFFGTIVGGIYGLFIDLAFGKTIGVFTLLYLALGFLCGKFYKSVATDNKMTLIVVSVIATIVFEVVSNIISIILYNIEFDVLYLLKVLILEAIYNLFLSMVFFRLIYFIGTQINRCKSDYYELRRY